MSPWGTKSNLNQSTLLEPLESPVKRAGIGNAPASEDRGVGVSTACVWQGEGERLLVGKS